MSYVMQFVDFLKENGSFMLDNWHIFTMWTLIVIALISLVFTLLGKKQRSEIKTLKNQINKLQSQINEQKKLYDKMEVETWAVAPQITPTGPAARGISDAMNNRKKKGTGKSQ